MGGKDCSVETWTHLCVSVSLGSITALPGTQMLYLFPFSPAPINFLLSLALWVVRVQGPDWEKQSQQQQSRAGRSGPPWVTGVATVRNASSPTVTYTQCR